MRILTLLQNGRLMSSSPFSESGIAFTPVNFFHLAVECRFLPLQAGENFSFDSKNYKKYLLPDLSSLTSEESFAQIALGWNLEGIEVYCRVAKAYEVSVYPQISHGDSLEVCIDTRNVKTSGYNTRFCHHFFALPEAVDGIQAGEITKFRTEDVHALCDPQDLRVTFSKGAKEYRLGLFIPASCLQNYDPEQFDQMGFTYRLNRPKKAPMHFSVSSKEYVWEQQPSLWSSVKLIP